MKTTETTETEIPLLIVDRSPELMRNASSFHSGTHRKNIDIPRNEDCVRGDGARCVLAEALKNAFGPGWEPHIEGEHPYIIDPNGFHRAIALDSALIEAIGKFDRGEPDAFRDIEIIVHWDL